MAQWVKAIAVDPHKLGLVPSPTEWKVRTKSVQLISDLKPFISCPPNTHRQRAHTGSREHK
jgi:glutamate/tyrosine decarboxylase-like PLP-dependent enzyme